MDEPTTNELRVAASGYAYSPGIGRLLRWAADRIDQLTLFYETHDPSEMRAALVVAVAAEADERIDELEKRIDGLEEHIDELGKVETELLDAIELALNYPLPSHVYTHLQNLKVKAWSVERLGRAGNVGRAGRVGRVGRDLDA